MKKIVIKIGTNVISTADGKLDLNIIRGIGEQVSALKKQGTQIIMVSSGAVGAGRSLVTGHDRMDTISRRQVLAAVGQVRLMGIYTDFFAQDGLLCAQVLATKEDFRDRRHYLNIRNCIDALLKKNVIPIVNENDVISISELMFTDNDELAGLIAAMMSVDALVILTNTDGVYDRSPSEKGAQVIKEINPKKLEYENFISPEKSSFGRGGMLTKCHVAEKLSYLGIATHVVNGKTDGIIKEVVDGVTGVSGKVPGTRFIPVRSSGGQKKRAAFARGFEKGIAVVDDGAAKALMSAEKVSSLLFVGVKRIEGDFAKGDIINIRTLRGEDVGMGIAQFDSVRARELIGKKDQKPLVHYNYLFLQK
jgi:glutamate 5-kinase